MIAELLQYGAENAITGKALSLKAGYCKRVTAKFIEIERRSGRPICATCKFPHGYYLARDKEELKAYCDTIQNRIDELNATRDELLKIMQKENINEWNLT